MSLCQGFSLAIKVVLWGICSTLYYLGFLQKWERRPHLPQWSAWSKLAWAGWQRPSLCNWSGVNFVNVMVPETWNDFVHLLGGIGDDLQLWGKHFSIPENQGSEKTSLMPKILLFVVTFLWAFWLLTLVPQEILTGGTVFVITVMIFSSDSSR